MSIFIRYSICAINLTLSDALQRETFLHSDLITETIVV